MSYMNPDRFTFAGTFQANSATVNNVTWNYGEHTPKDPVWNPNGTGGWKFENCAVQSASRSFTADPADPIVGMTFKTTDTPVEAKLVDLDPQQQMVSQIWGMKLSLGDPGGENSFTGTFRVAAFCDGYTRNPNLGRGSAAMSAFYQSVIEDIEWGSNITSPVLQKLADNGRTRTLSIKFNVDMHNNFADPPGAQGPTPRGYPVQTYPFTFGRVVGTIGPCEATEPAHFVSGRLLRAGQNPPPLYFAPCVVEGDHILVDLGNSTLAHPDGSVVDQGDLRLAILTPGGVDPSSATAMKTGLTNAGPATVHIFPEPLDYKSYVTDASVLAVPFESGMLPTIQNAPLGIVKVDENGNYLETMLAESSDGWFARADAFVFRFNPGDSGQVRVRTTRFGLPAPAGTEIALQKTRFGRIGNSELQALAVPPTVATGADGWAEFTMTGSDPGYPRKTGTVMDPNTGRPVRIELNLDGQLYAVRPTVVEAVPQNPDPWLFISVLLFTDWSKIANDFDAPTWDGDVASVMSQYASLYPVMKFIPLGDYTSVHHKLDQILQALHYPHTDPRHMPVTRDFSRSRLQLLENWKANGAPKS